MKKYRPFIIGIILLFVLLQCGSNSYIENNSLLWKISGNNLQQPSFLFGTIHLIPKDDYFFTDTMKHCFDQCDHLVLELDLGSFTMDDHKKLSAVSRLKNNKTLEDYVTKKEFKTITGYLKNNMKLNQEQIDNYLTYKPMFLIIKIISLSMGAITNYETALMTRAKMNKMEISGLETIDEQIEVLESLTMEDQLEDIEKIEEAPEEFNKLIDCYKEQDLKGIEKLTLKKEVTSRIGPEFFEIRNKKWIPVIEELMQKESIFVACGSGHLVGDIGIISLLREAGYTVTPVR